MATEQPERTHQVVKVRSPLALHDGVLAVDVGVRV